MGRRPGPRKHQGQGEQRARVARPHLQERLWVTAKTAKWRQQSGFLAITYQSAARDIAHKLKYHHLITEPDRRRAMAVYEIVCKHNIELLDEADELAEKDKADKLESTPESTPQNKKPIEDITLDLVSEMVEWDRRKRILEDWKWKVMDDVAKGRKPLTDRYKYTFYLNLELLRKKGLPNLVICRKERRARG